MSGYKIRKENIYLIRIYNEQEDFYKIGTSVHKFCRFYQIIKYGYRVDIIFMILGVDNFEAIEAEHFLHSLFLKYSYTPNIKFGGYTECFSKCLNIVKVSKILKDIKHGNGEIINLKISWR